jgi:hypothetical protein
VGLVLAGAAPRPVPICETELAAQRRAWRAVGEPRPQPPITDGVTVRHWATAATGVWLVEQTSATATTLTRVAADGLDRIEWADGCVPARRAEPRAPAAPPAFTDTDLAALVASGASGVIYLWSPHLPLSVDGYTHVAAAADRRGLRVEPLLAADADRRFAAEAITSGRLPVTALRAADAVELEFRGLALHAPAVQVFAGGALRGAVLPGYKTADEYAAFFSRVLDVP